MVVDEQRADGLRLKNLNRIYFGRRTKRQLWLKHTINHSIRQQQ